MDRIAFRGGLATGLGGGEEGVDVGVASEVADDGSDGADMKMKPLGDFIGGASLRGSRRGRSRSGVGPVNRVAGRGARVLGSEPWQLGPK